MLRATDIKLIKEVYKTDDIGQEVLDEEKTTSRELLCELKDIGMNEFYQANQQGIRPSVKALIFDLDYEGEKVAEINNIEYSVIRTFTKGDRIELYLETKVGDSNG